MVKSQQGNHLGKLKREELDHHVPHFNRDHACFRVGNDYFEEYSPNQGTPNDQKAPLLDVADGEAKVEALVCMWQIDHDGKLMKKNETTFTYDSLFTPT